jgi:large subunit ribosomal protein L9
VELPSTHIKTVGTHPVTVRLHPEVSASLSVEVIGSA